MHAGIGQRRSDFLGRRRLREQIRAAAGRVGLARACSARASALIAPNLAAQRGNRRRSFLPIVADFDGRKP